MNSMMPDPGVLVLPKKLVVLRAFTFAFSASLLVALLALIEQRWFGAGDLKAFIIFTGVFSILVAVVGVLAFPLLIRFPAWLRYTIGGIVGLAVGLLFTVGNLLFLGGWFGAWSIPVFMAWLSGGMAGIAGAAGTRLRAGVVRLAAEVLSFFCLLVGLSFGVPWAARVVTHNQELTVIFARWYPGGSQLSVEDPGGLLVPHDHEILRRAPLLGRVVVRSGLSSNSVKHPKARMLILVSGQQSQPVSLAQPNANTVVYWQDSAAFRRYPEDTEVLDRSVDLAPDDSRPGVTTYWVEHSSGGKSGADLFNWNKEP